jgi:activator of HSP90 ATPase
MELWTGYPATFIPEAGSEFELWEGDITGKVLEVVPNEKLVEQWYFEGQEEASIATIKFFIDKSKISVEVVHTNIPDDAFDNIYEGWDKYFLDAIKEFVEVG